MERILELPRRFDAAAARRLVAEFGDHRGGALRIDASAVESLSALGIEVVIAAARQWQADGHPIRLSGQSDRFAATCRTLGLCPDRPWDAPTGGQA